MFSRNCFPLAARVSSRVAGALTVALIAVPSLAAQALYMPRTIKKAYANGTRALDGNVGAKYWQNSARYAITITALPPDRRISGTEEITYRNQSPDTLRMLVIKLFANYHKPGAPRDGGASPEFLTSGVHIRSFAVNDMPQKWDDNPRFFTWQRVRLPSALAPKDSVRLALRWWYDLSRQPGREGVIDSTDRKSVV